MRKLLFISILLLIGFACNKDNGPSLGFELRASKIIYYPNRQIATTFDIVPIADAGHYTIKWYNPDSLEGTRPFTLNISKNVILDFEIIESENAVQRFQHEIKVDAIDSLKFDYRNDYFGTYSCNAIYTYGDSTIYFQDTLTVVKSNSFRMLNILTRYEQLNNYEGALMIYFNSNGKYGYPTGDFFGYHAMCSFSNDSIDFVVRGPLGYYYKIIYKGSRISQ